jgi:hypothetical protein
MTGATESLSPPAGSGTDGFRAESNWTGVAFAGATTALSVNNQTAVVSNRSGRLKVPDWNSGFSGTEPAKHFSRRANDFFMVVEGFLTGFPCLWPYG